MQKKSFRFDKKVCVGKNLNLGICSKFGGNFEGILGNPGEIPHIGWNTLGVYRAKPNSCITRARSLSTPDGILISDDRDKYAMNLQYFHFYNHTGRCRNDNKVLRT